MYINKRDDVEKLPTNLFRRRHRKKNKYIYKKKGIYLYINGMVILDKCATRYFKIYVFIIAKLMNIVH